eukprot:m.81313 g.81313  ORF g.81313 m.81313 type:complete len:91 (+) comp12052_c1_seq7:1260-1532(+)
MLLQFGSTHVFRFSNPRIPLQPISRRRSSTFMNARQHTQLITGARYRSSSLRVSLPNNGVVSTFNIQCNSLFSCHLISSDSMLLHLLFVA